MGQSDVTFQPTLLDLLDVRRPAVDSEFGTVRRHQLDGQSWVDHGPGWLTGSDEVFQALMEHARWRAEDRLMYGKMVPQPRLTARWLDDEEVAKATPVLARMRRLLSTRYGVDFDSGGLNLYRDGQDSVAWHRDRIPATIVDPVVAIVSIGEPRRFLLRPRGGGSSIPFHLGRGDLLVTGGRCQRDWEHQVPKVAAAGPRISITFRHSANPPPV